jgi:flagellar biogenesis protein FliO
MELSQQLTAICLVLALLGAGLLVAHRRGLVRLNLPSNRRAERRLEVVDRLALTPQHAIHFIRVEERHLLIATYPGGIEWLGSNEKQGSIHEQMAAVAGVGSESHYRGGRGAG